jgi:predicted nucleic acid-binding protein
VKQTPPVFVDTAYFVALLNKLDEEHGRALALAAAWDRLATRLTTTDAVLIETHNWFSRSPLRAVAARALRALRSANGWAIVHASAELIRRGEQRYAAHADKSWSLTDCISMEAASDVRATQVATTDKHFEQAGFEILMTGRV